MRAKVTEMRRKQLGYATRCYYCPESDLFSFEIDHPATYELDRDFKRVVCSNCHGKLERRRDTKRLTKNGKHRANESEREALRRYLLLMAEDQETMAEHAMTTPPELVTKALRETTASLRRKAEALSLSDPAPEILGQRPNCSRKGRLTADARQTHQSRRRSA